MSADFLSAVTVTVSICADAGRVKAPTSNKLLRSVSERTVPTVCDLAIKGLPKCPRMFLPLGGPLAQRFLESLVPSRFAKICGVWREIRGNVSIVNEIE